MPNANTTAAKTVRTVETTQMAYILRADPDYYRSLREHPEYKFSKRTFTTDPTKRGAYEIS